MGTKLAVLHMYMPQFAFYNALILLYLPPEHLVLDPTLLEKELENRLPQLETHTPLACATPSRFRTA